MDARMDILIEILLDGVAVDGTPVGNDIQWVLSDVQHVEDTINAAPGWWKENPADGVNIRSYLNSDGQAQVLARSISVQLKSDLYKVTNPQVYFDSNGQLYINPNATLS